MKREYAAVIVTNSVERAETATYMLMQNSPRLAQLIVVFDATKEVADGFRNSMSGWARIYEVEITVIPSAFREVYAMYNEGMAASKYEHVLLINDDMHMSRGWDAIFESGSLTTTTVATFTLVEPGYVSVSDKNILRDFGQTWDEFKRKQFEDFASEKFNLSYEVGLGWYMPVLFSKTLFFKYGGYPTTRPFPYPNDVIFFQFLQQQPEVRFIKYNILAYHFQRLAQRINLSSATKLNLCCGSDKREGYLNADIANSDFDVNILKLPLPFEDNKFEEVLFRHALEHFRYAHAIEILKELYRITKPGGLVIIHVPDFILAVEDLLRGYNQYPDCADPMLRIYGLNTSEEQVHKWGYTRESRQLILQEIGFGMITRVQTSIPDEICMTARKHV